MSCRNCSSINTKKVCELDNNNASSFAKYSALKYNGVLDEIVKSGTHPVINYCKNCDFYYYLNLPKDEELNKMYASGRFLYDEDTRNRAEREKINVLTGLVRRLIKLASRSENITLLDFGSGAGVLAKIAAKEGLNVTAYEPSLERNTVNQEDGIIFTNKLDSINAYKYDIIILNQVLEHVKSPSEVLRTLVKLSHSNSLIYVSVPNINHDLKNDKVWDEWPFDGLRTHIMAPFEHLNGFTPKSFNKALKLAGLEPVGFIKNYAFSPRLALIRSLYSLFRIGGTTRAICKVK